MVVLADSVLGDEYLPDGIRCERLRDGGESFQACCVIESGASLLMANSLQGSGYKSSLMTLAKDVMQGTDPRFRKYFQGDPKVNVIVMNLRGSVTDCRKEEQYPGVVADRKRSPLITRREVEWSMLDFEDVLQQRKNRRRFADLEKCRLRHKSGMYHQDRIHLKRKIRMPVCREIMKAMRRAAIARYGPSISDGILLFIWTGGNCEGSTYNSLDQTGKAWRRAELLACTELCALHGHRASAFHKKMKELCKWRRGSHRRFLKMPIRTIAKIPKRKRSAHMTRKNLYTSKVM